MRQICAALLLAGVIGALAAGPGSTGDASAWSSPQNAVVDDESVPTFRLPGLFGRRVDSTAYAGEPFVINFWRSDCRPCRKEFPLLGDIAQSGKVTVIGVNVQDIPSDARAFVRSQESEWTHGVDSRGDTARAFKVHGLPQTFFVAADGTVRQRIFGELSRADVRTGLRSIAVRSRT